MCDQAPWRSRRWRSAGRPTACSAASDAPCSHRWSGSYKLSTSAGSASVLQVPPVVAFTPWRAPGALHPQGELDLGLAVVIAADLPGDAAAVLAELIHKRLRRAIASAYDRGWSERGENR
jgi:hypothetical protein